MSGYAVKFVAFCWAFLALVAARFHDHLIHLSRRVFNGLNIILKNRA